MKKVSVILTTYMNAKYIGAAIDSVLKQTFRDYELIIVDDGSRDNTTEEVSRFVDERIKYIQAPHTGLPSSVRNRGIGIATGKLIALFDGDDIWHPRKLENCLEIFSKDETIDILCHDVNFLRSDNEKIFRRSFFGPYDEDMYKQLLLKGNALSPSATIIKRSIFSEDRFLFCEDKNLYTVEDYDLWIRLAKTKRYRFFYLPQILAEHRVFENSSTLQHIDKHALNLLYLLNNNFRDLDYNGRDLKPVIKKRKSRIMCGTALAFNYRRRFRESIEWLIRAINEDPFYWKSYLALLASLCRINLGYV